MWPQAINMLLGIWLMAAPEVFGYERPAANSDWIVGPLIATFGCIAIWEATRSLRWVNVPLGVWLLVAPWVLGYPAVAAINSAIVGLAVVSLSCLGGQTTEQFGGGWSVLWRRDRQRG